LINKHPELVTDDDIRAAGLDPAQWRDGEEDKMHHRVAVRDIKIELVERVTADCLEIFLNFYFNIMPCQIGP